MGHFQFFLHLKIKLRFCVFSSFLFGSISCCFTVIPAKHISGTTSNSEKPEILNSAADIFDPTVDVVVRAENSHTPSCLKKNVTRMATGGCFPWPSIECFSHCIRFHSLCLFVCLFLYWNGAFLHKQEGKHIALFIYLDHRTAASVRINWNDGDDPTPDLDCETNPSTATANVTEGRWFYFQCF